MLNNLFKIAGSYRFQLIRGTFLHIISSVLAATPYGFLYLILRELLSESIDSQKLTILTIAIALCLLLQGIFLYSANYLTYLTSHRAIADLRLQLGDRIRQLPMGFFNERQIGDLNGLVSDDMRKIEPIPSWVYPKVVTAIAFPATIAAFLAFIDWRLTLAMLAGVPISVIIYVSYQRSMRAIAKEQKAAIIEANSRTIEYIQGLATIKACNQTGTRFAKLQNALQEYKQVNLKMVSALTLPIVAFAGMLELGFAAVWAVGTYLLLQGEIAIAVFLLFLVLGLQFYTPIFGLMEFAAMTRIMDAALDRVAEVLNLSPLPEPQQSPKLERFDIEFKNVSFSYEGTPILQNMSFTVPEHSMTALIGASGSGKTTITNLIARFWDVDGGEICIGGHNIKNLHIDELLSHISIVFQDVYLFNDTIASNIRLGKPEATMAEVIAAAKSACCHDFIQQLPDGYHTQIGEGGTTLSGGEKQRIAIARAILKDAPIVLLDEATASIDPENELLVQKAINALTTSKTLIVIAHHLSSVAAAEQILVLDRGQIVEQGDRKKLLALNGVYKRFWDVQQQAKGWKLTATQS
ncbi:MULTISPECIES: ABC transporter ATP-binding protein [unclassified Roseofilum]|uniref:ABC transporter ATP-binding protein n=1 Tax=unclassified Roseofilum TaxID=2620099 RepID=UPI000E7DF29C|nr:MULTISPECIES: ABC transporter ATP-binding protein [unclassified Roseofilum]HBR00589.1 ABC transporter ATP-binding protein [Cyanobacteria bacterium UBA11691]MBP0007668.1 ABC transporter ATP-binding protein [Roseofilum sp. Belize Diploria]MBP0035540.1 ABC transporter ATP-binding protein [Roseofilum sp. Belize BBD 4]MBP0039731.1 ABC transporter ATP-binding protein [Roseofilum sp. SID1]MBP0043676.1 ABC transporter ATP-binding protein [Roseofilum sp. SBFL]